ncbi:MAG: glycosyltransferase [Desulfobacterales bacterium]|nr:glycosyltransferase [Desulfobacterales bacterium]
MQTLETYFLSNNAALCDKRFSHIDILFQENNSKSSKNSLKNQKYITVTNKRRENNYIEINSIIVLLGIDSFYRILRNIRSVLIEHAIILIADDSESFKSMLNKFDLSDIFNRKNFYITTDNDISNTVKYISQIQLKYSGKPLYFYENHETADLNIKFYSGVINAFKRDTKQNIYDQLKYKKFAEDKTKVLLLSGHYFITKEIVNTFNRMGIDYKPVDIKPGNRASQIFIEDIIKHIIEFKPDFLLTINHLGLDCEGKLAQFLEKIEMPLASWYVDDPNLIIRFHHNNITSYSTLFLCDKDRVQNTKDMGFEHSYYLPLGVDETVFRPIKTDSNPFSQYSPQVGFVGNSMVSKVKESLNRADVNGSLKPAFEEIAGMFMINNHRSIEETVLSVFPHISAEFISLSKEKRNNFEAALYWEATRRYRLKRISRLLPSNPIIAGDAGWKELIEENQFTHLPELSYHDQLPLFYNAIKINFNATSRQMKGAVNQRAFDVPACNRFLLTDFQEQIAELFDIGNDMICYNSPDEIEDLVRFYLNHGTERDRISKNGYQRVIKDHTYTIRIKNMIDIMKKLYH